MPTDLAVALALADHADAATMRRWRGPLQVRVKADRSVVTDAEVALDHELRGLLSGVRPDDRVVAEESGAAGPAGAARTWYIDPVDGTVDFVDGGAEFGTLIALVDDRGRLRLGVVSLPARGLRWWGVIRAGAYRVTGTGSVEAAKPASPRRLGDSRLVYRMPGSWDRRRYAAPLERLLETVGHVRVRGDASGPCDVASGAADLSLTCGGATWDLAAPMAVALASGAAASDFTGAVDPARHTLIAASDPGLLRDALAVLGDPR